MVEAMEAVPFQVQINYTKLNGCRCLRVVSDLKPLTFDREVAEENIDIEVLGVNVAQQSARLAQAGAVTQRRGFRLV